MTGPGDCAFNALHWNFLHNHCGSFSKTPRLSFMYATRDKFEPSPKNVIISKVSDILKAIREGKL